MKKVVFITDVRFWRCRTGAQQRINSLVHHLNNAGCKVTIAFTAPLDDENQPVGSEEMKGICDRSLIDESKLNVISLIDDWSPTGVIEKIKWKSKCILNAMSPVDRTTSSKSTTASLETLRTPEFIPRAKDLLERLTPDVVIVEYVTLAYLLPPKTDRNYLAVLDSHDLLSDRYRQFRAAGYTHWLEISEEEEFAAFQHFDSVLAIQRHEAKTIRDRIADVDVVVCGHPVAARNEGNQDCDIGPESKFTVGELGQECPSYVVGYFASDNPANRDALRWLLDSIWPIVMDQNSDIRLVLAGSVCQGLEAEQLPTAVNVLGSVDQVSDFYNQVDTVLNPIRFGTGLKIKNLEVLQFELPLISTGHGVEAMQNSGNESAPWIIADTATKFATAIIRLARSVEERKTMIENGKALAKQLTPDIVYGELMRYIEEH